MNRKIMHFLALSLAVMQILGLTACGGTKVPSLSEKTESAEESSAEGSNAVRADAEPADNGNAVVFETEGEDEPETTDGAAEDGMPVRADTPTTGDPDVYHTVKVTDVEDGTIVRVREYNYDDQWRKTETIEDGVVMEKYTYDQDGNVLTHWTTPPSLFVEYEYDSNGNLLSQTSYFFYEPNDEWTKHTYTLDSQGRKIADQLTRYDGTDRLYETWDYYSDGSCTGYLMDDDGETVIGIEEFNDHGDKTFVGVPGFEEADQEFVYEYSEEGFWYRKSSYRGGVLGQVDEYEIDEFGKQGAHYITTYDENGQEVLHYMFSDNQKDEKGNTLVIITYYSNYTDSPDQYSYYEKVNSQGEHIGGYPG